MERPLLKVLYTGGMHSARTEVLRGLQPRRRHRSTGMHPARMEVMGNWK